MNGLFAFVVAIREAAGGFLRGFLGLPSRAPAPGREGPDAIPADPSSVRAALATRCAARGNCC